jgi:hypothetical protein
MSVVIVAYYAFSLIVVGTIFNLLTFIILCQPKFRDANERPTLRYMRVVAIFDILILYGWNFDHYTLTIYGFELTRYTFTSCNYSWLRIFIASIISFFTLFNFHLIIFGCFNEPNGLVNINSSLYTINPMWDFINLVMCNCLPFLFMVIFNSGFIYHLIHLRHIITIHKSRIPHQAILITLVITTFLFLGHGYTSYSCLRIYLSIQQTILFCAH